MVRETRPFGIVPGMGGLPAGVVTFVFTDIEGSTRLWEDAPDQMIEALQQHDTEIDAAIEAHGGRSVKPRGEGDSRFIVFENARQAVEAVSDFQVRLASVEWATPRPIKIRASIHTGHADLQLGDYYGSAVNRAARLRAIAHGGQTVMSGSTWELIQDSPPQGATITDMGEHALKDLTRPEHVYQLNPSGLPTDFPPLASLDAVANNLPRQVTEFVGRTQELEQAKELLTKTRLLTILAPGGTGKTRLAIQAAADLTSDYPDGVFFISLAEVARLDDIIQAIAESIGVAFSSDQEPKVQLLNYLANKTQLLVFDNFEHVVESATVVLEILHSTAGIKVIVTSRAKLNVQGESVMHLGGLDITWDSEEKALASSGVRLFLDAATRADPTFTLDSADLEPLETILSVTGGMPLAIVLAAAWVDILPITEIAAEITKSLDFLETEMGDVPDRHRSVRAVFDYSWELLTPAERDVFAALSIFRGGFTREAADQIAGAGLRDLATLTGKSLITPNTAKDRYTVHELLRQFAEAELSADEERFQSVQGSHVEFFANMAVNEYERFLDAVQLETLAAIENDLENLREAWRAALSRRQAANARKLLNTLQVLYEVRGWYQAGASLWSDGLEAFPEYTGDEDSDVARAMVISALAYFRGLLGLPDPEPAMEAAAVLREIGTPAEMWSALQGIALCMSYLGRTKEMIKFTDEMIDVGKTLEEGMLNVGGRNWRSLAALLDEDPDTARELLPHALEVLQRHGEYYYRTWTLYLSASLATMSGDTARAIDLLSEQVEISRLLGYRRGMMVGLGGLGHAQLEAGNLDEAEHAFIESLAASEEMGIASEMLGSMVHTARVIALAGRSGEAAELLSSVLAEPMSAKQTMSDLVPVDVMANEVLDEIRPGLDDAELEAAVTAGRSTPYETAAKQLIDSIR